ncbi:MAG: hypothetical protein BWY24_00473 [Microgenomates group bacterium ADurb.Bin219]|nr:MAG: hypothetical protein BWY24_00473 [Microgenomates group bacterium ADurb.Bin219]
MNKKILLILILSFIIRIYFSFGAYHPDLGNHLDWGKKFWEYGPKRFYGATFWGVSWPNQPPGTMYLWAIMSKINFWLQDTFWKINLAVQFFPSNIIPFVQKNLPPALVKLPSILTDLGIGYLIYLFIGNLKFKKKKIWGKPLLAASLFLFNPVVIYNSSIWGQTDSLINFLFLLGVYLLLIKKNVFWGVFWILFSFYFKVSLLIFIPLMLVVLWKKFRTQPKAILSLISVFLLFVILSLPFSYKSPIKWLIDLYRTRILGGQGNMLTANAFNFWGLIFGIDFSRTDEGWFIGLSYRNWGYLFFAFFYLTILIKLIKTKFSINSIMASFVLISFASFLFMTNMHERYLYPAFPYMAVLVALSGLPFLFYNLVSLLHWLNLYHLWYYPDWPLLRSVIESNDLIFTRIFSALLLLLFLIFFLNFLRNDSSQKLTQKV